MTLRPLLHATLAVIVLPLVVACSSKPTSKEGSVTRGTTGAFTITPAQRARIHTQPIALSSFTPVVQTTGTVQFNGDRSTQVIATVGGPVTRIFVEPGAVVQAGTPLAAVSSPDFAAAVASYRKSQGTAQNLRRIADQNQQLFNNDALARRDLEQAQTDAASAEADRDAAVEQMRALGVEESTIRAIQENKPTGVLQAVIRSPISGTVVERLIAPGQLITAGSTPAFTVADLSTVWVAASIFETDLASVTRGARAIISSDAAPHPITGTVDYVAALVDSASKATSVRILAPNPGQLLKRDMYVRVAIQATHPKRGIMAASSAVMRDDDNLPFVFVMSPDGSFSRRRVTLGAQIGDSYEILTGLAPGDTVVTDGALFLQFAESQ